VASITEGSTYTLHPLFSDPGQDALTIVRVDWGDGSASTYPGTLSNIVHNYAAEPSHYTITFQAYDEDETYPGNYGTSAYTASVALTVNEAAQSDWISLPSSIFPHNAYNYTVGVSDPGGDLATYTIDWGDGTTSSTTVSGTSVVFAHIYASNSNYNMTVTAVDEDSAYNGHFVAVVSDVPTANAYGDNGGGSIIEGSSYKLQATFNDLANHIASSWAINWGDNHVDTENTSAGPFYHTYAEAFNSYIIRASAYDVDGVTTLNVDATIVEATAVATVWGASTAYESSTPNYTLNFGFTDPEDSASSWWVDWGDGTPAVVYGGAPSTAAHGYAEPGTYHPKFVAPDEDHPTLASNGSDGNYSALTTVTISEASGAQAGLAGSSTVTEGSEYDLTIGFSDPGGDTPSDYKINWGEGAGVQDYPNATTNVFTHIYHDASSNYVITASAITEDDNTGEYSSTHSLAVRGVAPLMWVTGPTTTQQGADYSVSLAALYPPNDPDGETPGALNWTVDWGDGQDPAHPDTTTVTGSSVNSPVHHTYMQAGQFVVTATASDDDTTWSLVLLNGQLDVAFGPAHDGIVTTDFNTPDQHDEGRSVALQPIGGGLFKIVAAGVTYSGTGDPQVVLARYTSDGTLDTGFGDPGTGQLRTGKIVSSFDASGGSAMVIQPDGSILVAATSGAGLFTLARYSPDGTSLDPTFGPNHTGIVSLPLTGSNFSTVALAIQSLPGGDRIIVAQSVGGFYTLSRYDMSGNYDTAFGTVTTTVRGSSVCGALAIDAEFNILIAGQSTAGQFVVSRYAPDGTIDHTFGGGQVTTSLPGGGMVGGVSIAVQGDGKVVLAGTDQTDTAVEFALARYNPDGTLDSTSFGTAGTGGITITQFPQGVGAYALALAVQDDADGNTSRIVVAGTAAGGVALAGYTASGTLDPTFGIAGILETPLQDGASRATDLLVQPDGKILLTGTANDTFALVSMSDLELARYEQTNVLAVTPLAGNLAASATPSEIDLAWTDNTPADTQVTLQRSTDGATTFPDLITVTASNGSYSDTNVSAGGHYYYRLKAATALSQTVYSNVVDVTVPAPPDTVTADGPGAGAAGAELLFKFNPRQKAGINQWVVNWGDGSAPQAVASNGLETSVPHTFAAAGDYVISATASDGTHSFTSDPLPFAALSAADAAAAADAPANIAINFEPATRDIPDGSLIDVGHVYSSRGDYFSYDQDYVYGWNVNMTPNAVQRAPGLSSDRRSLDQRYNTFMPMQVGGVDQSWSIALPDGTYQVHIAAGDPAATNSDYQILANGVTVVSGVPTTAHPWQEGTVPVLVTDGRLTLSNGPGAVNNKIDYVEITAAQFADAAPAAPGGVSAVAASRTAVDVHWTDDAAGETGFIVQRSDNGGHWTSVATTGPNAQAYFDTGLSPSTSYAYRVLATNAMAPVGVPQSGPPAAVATPAVPAETPYGRATPWDVTQRIEAENFDTGGEGVAYHDDNSDNIGGQYRNTGVDIGPNDYPSSPGYMVGWTHAGEWMNYTVRIAAAGQYRLDFRLASSGPGGQFAVRVDGQTVSNPISIPDTGGWGSYVTLSQEGVSLPSGTHVIQLYMQKVGVDGGVANCDWFQAALMPPASPTPTPPAAPEALTAAPANESAGGIVLDWQLPPTPSTATGFQIERSDDGGVDFSPVTPTTSLTATTTSYTDTSVTPGNACVYRVMAVNGSGQANVSAPSNLAAVRVPPAGSMVEGAYRDASARQASATVNYGSTSPLYARGLSGGNDSQVYLTFDTTGSRAPIGRVVLRLFGRLDGSNQTGVTVDVKGVTDTAWGENSLTWNSRDTAAVGPTLSTATVNEGMGRWYEWDVTSFVQQQLQQGSHLIGLMLAPTVAAGANVVFNSKEAATDQPALIMSPAGTSAAPTIDPVPDQFWLPNTLHTVVTHFHEPNPTAIDTVTVDWQDGNGPQPVSFNGNEIDLSHSYTETSVPYEYGVTITLTNDQGQSASRYFVVNVVTSLVGGTIAGKVWSDHNKDGTQDTGWNGLEESGLLAWTVYLDLNGDGRYDNGEPHTTTGADGSYTFAGVAPGTYALRVDLQSGYTPTSPADGSHPITIDNSGTVFTGQDFGVFNDNAPQFDPASPPQALINPLGDTAHYPPATLWSPGDVFQSASADGKLVEYGADGTLKRIWNVASNPNALTEYAPDGSVLSTSNVDWLGAEDAFGGMAFAPDGSLVLTNQPGLNVFKLDPSGHSVSDVSTGDNALPIVKPEFVVFDALGNMYVGNTGKADFADPNKHVGIYKFDPEGRLVDNYAQGQQIDWGDLAADQHTLLFTFEGVDGIEGQAQIFSLNTDNGVYFKALPDTTILDPSGNPLTVHTLDGTDAQGQPAQFELNEAFALRVLPDGDVLLAGTVRKIHAGQVSTDDEIQGVFRIHGLVNETQMPGGPGTGPTITQTYATNIPKHWFALNLDPDGTSFWSAGLGDQNSTDDGLYKFDIASGTLLERIQTAYPSAAYPSVGLNVGVSSGITVYGERTAAVPVNQQYTYQVHATDPEQDPVTYAFSGDAHGASLDPSSGVITWSPTAVGSFSFTVTATDNYGLQSFTPLTILVAYVENQADHAPVLPDATLSPAMVQRWYTGRVGASDADQDRLIYSLVDSPDFTIDPATGEFQWLPTAQDLQHGTKSVTVRVTDSRGASDQRTFTVRVLAGGVSTDDPPMIYAGSPPSDAMVGQPFTYLPTFDYTADALEFLPATVPRGMSVNPANGSVTWTPTPDQAGVQTFTLGLFDLDQVTTDITSPYILARAGYTQRTFTVNVIAAPLTLQGVHPTQISPTTWQLDAVLSDAAQLARSTFSWTWPTGAGIPPAPQVQYLTPNHSSILATFTQAGDYGFALQATDSGVNLPSQSLSLPVDPQPTRITARVPALVIGPQQVLNPAYMDAVVYDQFGAPYSTPPSPLAWSLIAGASGGAFQPDDTYKTGALTGTTDVLRVSLTQGATVVYDDVSLVVSTVDALVGNAPTGLTATEDQTTAFAPLAYFYDSAAGAAASNYTVSIDWGDGSSPSTGGAVTVAASTDPAISSNDRAHLFLITASHDYAHDRTYAFTVHVTAPGGRTLTIVPDDAGVVVQDARIAVTAVPLTPTVWRQMPADTVVATFTDASSASNVLEFQALIDWGDGSDPEPGTIHQVSAGNYEVRGSHLFSKLGTPVTAKVEILEVDDGGGQFRAGAPLQITVGESALPAVTQVIALGVAPDLNNHPQIVLTWDFITGLAGGYIVKRFNPDGSVTTLPTPDASGTQRLVVGVPWSDTTNLQPDTRYGYEVITTDPYGNQADPSPIVYATTWPDSPAIANLQANVDSAGHVHLLWTPPSDGQVWDVLRAKGDGTTKPPDPQRFTSILGTAAPIAGTDYLDISASASTQYWYEVVAVEAFGKRGAPSSATYITTGAPSGVTQVAPANLTAGYAGDYQTTRRVGLQWDAPAGDALLGFDVYRDTVANFTLDATTLIGSSADRRYTDDIPNSAHTEFYYAVKAVSVGPDGGEISSAASNVAYVTTTPAPVLPPAAPTGLQATATAGQGSIPVTIAWSEPRLTEELSTFPNREMGFEIRRGPDNGSGTPPSWDSMTFVGLATQDATLFVDAAATAGAPYYYEVASYDVGTQTGTAYPTGSQSQIYNPSAALRFATPSSGPAPLAPQNLREDAADSTYARTHLNWDAVSSTSSYTVAGYNLYRSTGSGQPPIRLNSDPLTSPSYVDAAVVSGTAYTYYVTAVSDGNSQSSPSNTLGVTAPAAPDMRPAATITSPSPFNGINFNFATSSQTDGRLRVLTPIRAVIDDPNGDLVSWSLVLRPANLAAGVTAQDILLASGNTTQGTGHNADGSLKEPGGALLYTLDPTLFPSGNYQLVLTASDGVGAGDPSIVPVSLYSQAKLGNLTLPVTDLSLDVPGGPITVSRVYDSQNADVLGELGYGWKLEISDTSLRTTATAGTGDRGGGNTLRPGDQVYVTLPGGQQHAFQFWPVPANYKVSTGPDPYGPGYVTYWVQFVCVDGSNATLRVQGDIHDPSTDDRVSLEYDKVNNEFHAAAGGQDLSYDPARPEFGRYYEVQTQGGAVYHVDAVGGNLLWSQDPNGNTITYGHDTVTGGKFNLDVQRNDAGLIIQITVSGYVGGFGAETLGIVIYNYDVGTSLLASVTGRDGLTTTYTYGTGPQAHYLTQVTDPRGLATLTAAYDSPLNRLNLLTDAQGNSVPLSTPSSDGSQGSQGVTAPSDPAEPMSNNNKTEAVYDDHGDTVRQIQTLTDSLGNVTGYSVTVSEYGYFTGDLSGELTDVFNVTDNLGVQPGESSQNALVWQKAYAPFVIQGADTDGLRYTQAPAAPLGETDYNISTGGNNYGLHLPSLQTDYLPGGDTRVTAYTNYTALGMPQNVTVTLHHGGSQVTVSSTRTVYDANGNLRYSFNAAGEGTEYVYSDGTNADPLTADDMGVGVATAAALPKGLLLATYRVTGDNAATNPTRIDGNAHPLTSNTYYRSTTVLRDNAGATYAVPASYYGKLRSSTDANGQETRYLYDLNGNPTYQLTAKTWTDATGGQTTGWVGTRTQYDSTGQRPTQTSQVVYVDASLHVDRYGGVQNNSYIPPGTNYDYRFTTNTTTYDAAGQVSMTEDAHGSQTAYTYDADKAVVRTVYDANYSPVSTESRTVYDALGRVSWQTDRFRLSNTSDINSSDNTAFATHTVYDALGRVVETDRYEGTQINVSAPETHLSNGGRFTVGASTLVSAGTLISSTKTIYNDQGQVAENISNISPSLGDASGLRTGTVYYPDGRVQYSGVLKSSAVGSGSNAWWAGTDTTITADNHPDPHLFPGQYFSSYSQNIYDQIDTSTGKPYSGLVYDRTLDPDGHKTDGYRDSLGRVAFTVYDDGSYTQTLYGVSKDPVPGHEPTSANPLIAMAGQVIDGYQVTKIDAMGNATDSFYDHAGHLTDVWLPAVADAKQPDPNHAGQYLMARPHWHYAYDASGDEILQQDPDGNSTTFAYDEQRHQVIKTLQDAATTAQDGQTTRSFYDAYGRLLAVKLYATSDPATAAVQTTTYGYWGDMFHPDYHPGRVADEYRFDGDVSITRATGWAERTHYTYDDNADPVVPAGEQLMQGRVAQVDEYLRAGDGTTPLAHSTHTTYDPVTGQPSSITSPEGVIHYEYDPKSGRHVRTWTDHNGSVGNDTVYAYDEQGRLQDVYEVVLNGTRYATYAGLDANGQPTFTGGTPPVTAYTYDPAGNLKTDALPDGVTTSYTYDDLNRLTDLSSLNTTTSHLVFAEHYDLRLDGLRSDVVDTRYNDDGSLFSKTKVNWTYDADGRLTDEAEIILDDGTGGVTNANGHAPAPYADHYAFDLANNRLSKGIAGGATITYTYTNEDQLSTESDGSTYDTSYLYDTSGNQHFKTVYVHNTTTVTEHDAYTWDLRNRMIEVSMTVGTVTTDTSYAYDSDGVRVSETTGSSSTYYLNDQINPTGYAKAVEESGTLNAAPTRSYVLGLAVLGQKDTASGVQYLLTDGHGSTRALLDVSGGVTQRFNYYAYGEALGFDAKLAKTVWLFGGDGLYDPSSGFTYELARWREGFAFISRDPRSGYNADPLTLHRYAYANLDPIRFIDPSGHEGNASESLSVIGVIQNSLIRLVSSTVGRAIAAAGPVLGRYWSQVGSIVERIVDEVVELLPEIESENPQQAFGGDGRAGPFVDRILQYGGRVLNLEAKYSLNAEESEDAATRAVRQIITALDEGEGDVVVYIARSPSNATLRYLANAIGLENIDKVKIISDPTTLYKYLVEYFYK
jgi:uncharacterized delta-60 repeat protein